jgi:hypothetical protein
MGFEEALRELIARHIEEQGTQGIQDTLARELALVRNNERELLTSDGDWHALRFAYEALCERHPIPTN